MAEEIKLEDWVLTKTTEAQWRRIQEYHVDTWGGGVSIEDYQKRKTLLCVDSEFSKKGNFQGWALAPKDDLETLTRMASFCDTYDRPIFIKDHSRPEGEELRCTCVVSVVVHSCVGIPSQSRKLCAKLRQYRQFRGRGYANHMLNLLHEEMAKQSIMSILYSDIGDYYSRVRRTHPDKNKRVGWISEGSKHVVWVTNAVDCPLQQVPVFTLTEAEVAKICSYDAEFLRKEVLNSGKESAFTVIPTEDQFDWQFRRTRFFVDLRHPPSRYNHSRISDAGCQLGHLGQDDWAFAIWQYDVIINELNILRLRCKTSEQLSIILQQAQVAARKHGMKTITAWNVDEKLLEGTAWHNVERKDHIPALAWYGEGVRPEWICNENWIRC